MIRRFVAIAALLILSACATGASPTNLQFAPDSPKAIVVVGMNGFDQWRGMSVFVHFRGVDASGAPDDRRFHVSNGNGWRPMNESEYFVVEVDPGSYIASNTFTHDGISQTIATYCLGTIRFDVQAGQVVYIGNFSVPRGANSIRPSTPDLSAATAKLAEYPDVRQSISTATVSNVPYPQSRECRTAQ